MQSIKIKALLVIVLCVIAFATVRADDDIKEFAANCAILSSSDSDAFWWMRATDTLHLIRESKAMHLCLTETDLEARDHFKELYEALRERCNEVKKELAE